ncbi:MAG: hypothetical protein JWO23_1105, partial [Solirubrobacterales bacterium]|nr:hypothetical protein [Solirubrobacterales bacterium]
MTAPGPPRRVLSVTAALAVVLGALLASPAPAPAAARANVGCNSRWPVVAYRATEGASQS